MSIGGVPAADTEETLQHICIVQTLLPINFSTGVPASSPHWVFLHLENPHFDALEVVLQTYGFYSCPTIELTMCFEPAIVAIRGPNIYKGGRLLMFLC